MYTTFIEEAWKEANNRKTPTKHNMNDSHSHLPLCVRARVFRTLGIDAFILDIMFIGVIPISKWLVFIITCFVS